MGQKQSTSPPTPPTPTTPTPTTPTPSPRLSQAEQARIDCQVNDVELNMTRRDLAAKDEKWSTCYPDQAIQKRLDTLRNETNAYINAKRAEQREANAAFQTKLNAVQKMTILSNELKTNLGRKLNELKTLTSNRENLEQYERRERRAFLDNSPQSGVGGVPGVRTSDDRALLTFWITYGAAIIMASLFVLNIYGDKLGAADMKSKAQIISALLLVAYFIAYYLISYYG